MFRTTSNIELDVGDVNFVGKVLQGYEELEDNSVSQLLSAIVNGRGDDRAPHSASSTPTHSPHVPPTLPCHLLNLPLLLTLKLLPLLPAIPFLLLSLSLLLSQTLFPQTLFPTHHDHLNVNNLAMTLCLSKTSTNHHTTKELPPNTSYYH